MLVALSCIGVCAHGAVVAVAHRPPPTGLPAGSVVPSPVVLGPVERGSAARALNEWVGAGGAAVLPLPEDLRRLSVPWSPPR